MFLGSGGSISRTACAHPAAFSPQSKEELESAVTAYLKLSPNGDCSDDCSDYPHGPIGEWDLSRVTDMSGMFLSTKEFNGDISKWDVSRVRDMSAMFFDAEAFNGDISKWDVFNVESMNSCLLYTSPSPRD